MTCTDWCTTPWSLLCTVSAFSFLSSRNRRLRSGYRPGASQEACRPAQSQVPRGMSSFRRSAIQRVQLRGDRLNSQPHVCDRVAAVAIQPPLSPRKPLPTPTTAPSLLPLEPAALPLRSSLPLSPPSPWTGSSSCPWTRSQHSPSTR